MEDFTKKYDKEIIGVISCYDRILLRGTLPSCCHSQAMENLLYNKGIRVFDYPKYAQSMRDNIRKHIENIAKKMKLT